MTNTTMACTDECPHSNECSNNATSINLVYKEYEDCLALAIKLFLSWESDALEWISGTLQPMMTKENSELYAFLFYFFQTAYQMGMPLERRTEEHQEEQL